MSTGGISLCLVLFIVGSSCALSTESTVLTTTTATPNTSTTQSPTTSTTVGPPIKMDEDVIKNVNKIIAQAETNRRIKIASRIQDTLKKVKQATEPNGLLEKTVTTNFLHSLYQMANSSAIAGTNVSRAAGTVIRGFVQDQFNLVSIAFYFPRLIFLDGPTQFIETLRLIRSNQIRAPMNMNEAIDTLINFASIARESQLTMNVGTPFLSVWPNIFRGAELLSTEVLYGVFSWLGPISPSDVSAAAVEGLWNRWDVKPSTTSKYDYDVNFRLKHRDPTNIPLSHRVQAG